MLNLKIVDIEIAENSQNLGKHPVKIKDFNFFLPVTDLAGPEDESVRLGAAQLLDDLGAPAGGVGQQPDREENRREHLHRPAELQQEEH